jgi:hypothetical protein
LEPPFYLCWKITASRDGEVDSRKVEREMGKVKKEMGQE